MSSQIDCNNLLSDISPKVKGLFTTLHETAVKNGCQYRIDKDDSYYNIYYSLRGFNIRIDGETIGFCGEYDIRAFMNLYKSTDNELVKELMFEAAISCEYCIDDKCTTFLMAPERTIEFNGKKKKLCAPYRHYLILPVTEDNLSACNTIARMMFEYTYPYMHSNLFEQNDVTYKITQKDDFYIVGFKAVHNRFTVSDEEYVLSILKENANGRRKIDEVLEAAGQSDNGRYVGAIENFINGSLYDFIFGVICKTRPIDLPENMVCRKIRCGEWAVYNSSADDYKSIWKHFTESFYDIEKRGYDTARIPFEYYDKNGKLSDIHIPVDKDMDKDSGKVRILTHTPNLKMAGFTNYNENDHPLHNEYAFEVRDKLWELFPLADMIIDTSIHSIFGKPMKLMSGVVIDDFTPVPEGVEVYELQGGYWHLEGRKHFNGGCCDWNFDNFYDSKVKHDSLAHPRSFDMYVYNSRGGYHEIISPVRVRGKQSYEVVELSPLRLIGKLEDPPDSIVTDEEKLRFYTLDINNDKGSYMIGYTLTKANSMLYYDKPLIKGVPVDDDTEAPDGYSVFMLESGKYLKITEDIPLGEPGWEIEYVNNPDFAKDTGYEPDFSRQFIIKQYGYGKSYEFYVPVF